MFVSTALRQRFEASLPHIQAVASEVRATLLTFCEQKGHAFQSRIKDLESLAEKIECGRYATWWDLDDLFACTVIIPTLNDESSVEEFCNSVFLLHRARRRGTPEKPFDVFRFDTTRLYYRLRSPMGEDVSGIPRSLSLLQFCFAEATLNSLIVRTRENYTLPITPELESLYPHVRGYTQRFSLD